MKVLLIQPKIGYMDALRSAPGLPLGLLQVGASLRGDFAVQILDQRIEADFESALSAALKPETVFVGITAHTGPMILEALKISRLVKARSKSPVVWGGVHASLLPEQTVADPAVDICVIGEGEATAPKLAAALRHGRDLSDVKGIAFKDKGKVHVTPCRELLDPALWPEPDISLVDPRRYLPLYAGRKSLFFQASRGCPFRCGYCYNAPYNRRKYRKLAPERVLAIIAGWRKRFDFQDVYFVDDNFFVDLDWAMSIAEGLAETDMTWQVQGVDVNALLRMNRGYLLALKTSGCTRLTIGVETAGDRMRELIHKQGKKGDVIEAVSRLSGTGISVFASFMVGFPGESLEEMKQTVDLALELLRRFSFLRVSPFYCYSPFPGTESFDAAVAEGFEPPTELSGWAQIGAFDRFTWERSAKGRTFDREFFEGLNTATLFIDKKVTDYSDSAVLKTLAALYRPVARWRARNMFFSLMPERRIVRRMIQGKPEDH